MKGMHLPCENIARYVLPIFRSSIARELIEKYNYTEVEAAKKLGITQAAISQYLHSKRGYKGIPQCGDFLPSVQMAAREAAKRMATEEVDVEEITSNFCKLCMSFREKAKMK
jgi:hypothetical protein